MLFLKLLELNKKLYFYINIKYSNSILFYQFFFYKKQVVLVGVLAQRLFSEIGTFAFVLWDTGNFFYY